MSQRPLLRWKASLRPMQLDIVIRRLPGHYWVRPFVTLGGRTERGHGWLYRCVRRDAWVIGPLGFGLLRMPLNRHLPAHLREQRESQR